MISWRFWAALMVLAAAAVGSYARRPMAGISLRQPLRTLPWEIDGWQGIDVPLESRIVAAAGVDDYVNRFYNKDPVNSLGLYIGYYRSQATGESIHSPKNCLPGTGWQPVSSAIVQLPVSGGGHVPVNLYLVQSANERQVVLYWYQSHGRIIASEYWAKLYMIADAIRLNRTDGALVRINTTVEGSEEAARGRVLRFATELLPVLDQTIPK